MAFRREKISDYFLLDTRVENMFINEYMAAAPGDFIKVYLFAQMYADLGIEITNEEIGRSLGIDQEDVLKAWTYWEKKGIINKLYTDEKDRLKYDVEFVNLKEQLYGNKSAKKSKRAEFQASAADKEVQNLLASIEEMTGNVISGTEMMEIVSWINDYNVAPEVIEYAYRYSIKKKKKNIKYIEAIVRNWAEEGLADVAAIEKKLSEDERKHYMYDRVFKALGFHRNATEEEKRIMDTWFDVMEFSIEKVLEACKKTSGISSPNINYVNKILQNWHEDKNNVDKTGKRKDVSASQVAQYYELLAKKEKREAEERRQEVYAKVPRIKEIEGELNSLMVELSKVIISDRIDKAETTDSIKSNIDSLNFEEAFLLTDNGFELDYMQVHYQCEKCKDTGILETGERCQCFGEITKEKIDLMSKQAQ